jgi:hypothetical protein
VSSSRPGALGANGSTLTARRWVDARLVFRAGTRRAGVAACAVRSGDGAVVVGVAVVSNTISTGRAISISPSMRRLTGYPSCAPTDSIAMRRLLLGSWIPDRRKN